MKKILLLSFCLIIYIGKAQTYSITPAKTVSISAQLNNISNKYIYMPNTGGAKIILKWKKISDNLPAGWDYSMCDKGNCYAGVPVGPTTMDTVYVSDQGYFNLAVDPLNELGSGTVRIYMWQDGFESAGDTLTWHVNAIPVSVEELKLSDNIQIFPNPASSNLNIVLNDSKFHDIEIKSIVGQVIFNGEVKSGTNNIDVSNFSKGIYFIYLKNEDKTLYSKIIID